MSVNPNLRISVNLFQFYNDFRQQSRVFISTDIKTIEDLQNYIKESFGITRNFYLQCENYYLPPNQDIRVLKYDDLVYVIQANEKEELITEVPKKRKRKRSIDSYTTPIEENLETVSKTKHKTKKKHKDNESNKVIGNNESKEEKKEEKSTHKILKEMNSVSHILSIITQESDNTQNISSEENIIKRRRVRTRKRSKKTINNLQTPEKTADFIEETVYDPPKSIAAPRIHKRFSDEDMSDNLISPDFSKTNGLTMVSSSPYVVNGMRAPALSVVHEEYLPENLKKMYLESEKLLIEPPKQNDKIIFKKLKLNEEYTPVESNYIFAEVTFIADEKLELKIIAGQEELKEPQGRFSILDEESKEEEEDYSVAYLEWNELIQPKLIEI